jgi:hypothetical protein
VVQKLVPVEKGGADITMVSGVPDGDATASSIEGDIGMELSELTLS